MTFTWQDFGPVNLACNDRILIGSELLFGGDSIKVSPTEAPAIASRIGYDVAKLRAEVERDKSVVQVRFADYRGAAE